MMKVEPYEHKGFRIREGITNISELVELYQNETDIWLKKLCAKRILEHEKFSELEIDKEDLLKSMQCQIEL